MVYQARVFPSPAKRHDRYGSQRFEQDGRPTLHAANSSGSNLGSTSKKLVDAVVGRVEAYRKENGLGPTDPVPVDAVTASGSGLDPDISVANARIQAKRVAAARGIPEQQVLTLFEAHTQGPQFGVLGYPLVNVLEVNLALDHIALHTPGK